MHFIPPEGLVIGIFVGPHGIRGEARLRPVTEFPERIPRLKLLRIRRPDGSLEERAILRVRPHKGQYLVLLEGVGDMDAAEALRGSEALVGAEDAVPLPEGRYYHHEIVGLRVVTPAGEELGRIDRILESGANDVYAAGALLIPATRDAVLRIDPEQGVLVVRSRAYLEGEEVL